MAEVYTATPSFVGDVQAYFDGAAEATVDPEVLAQAVTTVEDTHLDIRAAMVSHGERGLPTGTIHGIRANVSTAVDTVYGTPGLENPRHLVASLHLRAALAEGHAQDGSLLAALGHVGLGVVRLPGMNREPMADEKHRPVSVGMLLRAGGLAISRRFGSEPHPDTPGDALSRHRQRQENRRNELMNNGRPVMVS